MQENIFEKVLGTDMRHIYVMQNDLKEVKIGVARNVDARKSVIQTASGHRIEKVYHTDKCTNFFEIEKLCHNYFSTKRRMGEWFDVDFELACNVVDDLFAKNFKVTPSEKGKTDNKDLFDSIFNPYSNSPLGYVCNMKVGELIAEMCNYIDENNEVQKTKCLPSSPYWKRNELLIVLLYCVLEYSSMIAQEKDFENFDRLIAMYDECEVFDHELTILIDKVPFYEE